MADVWPVISPIGIVALKPYPTQFFADELSRKQSDYPSGNCDEPVIG